MKGHRLRSPAAEIRHARRDIARRQTVDDMTQAIADHRAGLHHDLYLHTSMCFACLALVRRIRKDADARRGRG